MKILGIGNAIVDVICKVEDDFIQKNGLTKSTMKLIFDEKEFKQLLSNLKLKKQSQVDLLQIRLLVFLNLKTMLVLLVK